jgi:autotransporter-associated beta strand protein/T5SS/PEP-CTERM-associated repeat protein
MRVFRGMARQRHMLPAVALTALLVGLGGSPGYGSDNLWTGASSSDWNDGSNWSFGGVPIGDFNENAVVGTDAPNIATITADLLFTPSDIVVTGGGRIDHQAGVAGTGGGAWMFVGQDGTPSFYNLADTSTPGSGITGFAQGTGTLNPTGNLMVGAWAADRQGTININTTGGVTISGGLFIANDNGCIGTMNLESGTIVVLHEPGFATDNTQVGNNGGTGTLTISGGSFDASRNFRVGNEGGMGTVTISGGALTIAGTDDIFIGRDRGTGVVNQSGGVVDFAHNTYIGNGNNAGSDTSGTYTLSDGVWNVRRELVVGREGANATHAGTLTMTGGTINKTGDEKMIVGQNNGKGTVTQSGGTINVNNELFIGNENAGAEGTYTISGTAALNVANELIVGRESGTGTLNVDGGTITTTGNGNMYIGRKNGTGFLNQTAGLISVNREFGVGTTQDGQAGIGSYDFSGGSLTATGNIFIGKEQASSGTMVMTGGTLSTSDKLQIGHNQATGALTQSGGIVNVQNEVFIGNETSAASIGTYTLGGSAELNVGNEVIVGRDNGIGTFNLDGGTVIATRISGGTGTSTVNFNGGVIRAKRDEANFIESLGTANVASGGITIDSNGFNVAVNQSLSGIGGLEKVGIGSLALSGVHTYAGPTRVSAGTLRLEPNSSITSAVTVDSGASLAGSGTVEGSVVIGTGATLSPGASPGTLTVSGNVTLGSGGNYNWQVYDAAGTAGSTTGWDLLSVGGVLDVAATSADRVNLNLWSLSGVSPDVNGSAVNFNSAQNGSWTIASAAGGITGFAADKFTVNTAAANGAAGFANDLAGGSFAVVQQGNDLLLQFTAAGGPTPDPVKITGVYVKGSTWNAGYLDRSPFSDVQGATVGWELPDGSAQLANSSNVAWNNVDTITVQFDQPIAQPDAAALQLVRGTASGNQTIVPTLAPTLLGDGSVAQWTLPAEFANLERGKYVISIAGEGITNTDGTAILDGDWITSVSTFAEGSGDGQPGGAFNFFFNSLVGDVNGDGVMNAGDLSSIRSALTSPLNTPLAADSSNYRLDIDGLNSLNSADLSKTRAQLTSALGTQLASLPAVTAPTAGGNLNIAAVPEPTLGLAGLAAIAAVGLALRRRHGTGLSAGAV